MTISVDLFTSAGDLIKTLVTDSKESVKFYCLKHYEVIYWIGDAGYNKDNVCSIIVLENK